MLDMIITLNNLSYVLVKTDQYDFACAFLEYSLMMQESMVQPINYALAMGTMESLAFAYSESKREKKGLEIYKHIMDLKRRLLNEQQSAEESIKRTLSMRRIW